MQSGTEPGTGSVEGPAGAPAGGGPSAEPATPAPEPPQRAPRSSAGLARTILRAHRAAFLEIVARSQESGGARSAEERTVEQPAAIPGSDEVESIHDLRVTTRRLRATIWLFGDVLPPEAKRLRRELRWVARRLGRVRDLDVQAGRLAAWRDEAAPDLQAGYGALLDALAVERAEALARFEEALESVRYAALVAALNALVEAPKSDRSDLDLAALVRRRYRAVRRAGDRLTAGSRPRALHRLRVAGKRLRYTLESLAPAYGEPAHRLLRRLVALQDVLGDYQDARVAADHLRRVERRLDGPTGDAGRAAAADALARYADLASARRRQLPAAYAAIRGRAWRRLREAMDLAAVTPSRPDPAGTPASPEP